MFTTMIPFSSCFLMNSKDFRTFVVQQHANMCSNRSTDHFEHELVSAFLIVNPNDEMILQSPVGP